MIKLWCLYLDSATTTLKATTNPESSNFNKTIKPTNSYTVNSNRTFVTTQSATGRSIEVNSTNRYGEYFFLKLCLQTFLSHTAMLLLWNLVLCFIVAKTFEIICLLVVVILFCCLRSTLAIYTSDFFYILNKILYNNIISCSSFSIYLFDWKAEVS